MPVVPSTTTDAGYVTVVRFDPIGTFHTNRAHATDTPIVMNPAQSFGPYQFDLGWVSASSP